MKLEIIEDIPVASCKVDMHMFKRLFSQSLDMQRSFAHSLKIVKPGPYTKQVLIKGMYYFLDWVMIFRVMNKNPDQYMEIDWYAIKYTDKVEYKPGASDTKTFFFKAELSTGVGVLMVNKYINNTDADINAFFNATTYIYGDKEWSRMFEVGN